MLLLRGGTTMLSRSQMGAWQDLERARKRSRKGRGGKAIHYEPVEWEIDPPKLKPTHCEETGWDSRTSRRTGVIARKVGMTSLFDEWGEQVPLTLLQIENCQVLQKKTVAKEGYNALQVGAGDQLPHRVSKPFLMHCKKAGCEKPKFRVSEFHVSEDCLLEEGTRIYARHFMAGQYIDVQGTTQGKGFQGVMKRFNFGGLHASHGVSRAHRKAGATGACQDPGRVWKGKKMAGRMGGKTRTTKNLRVYRVSPLLELLWVVGAVPGPANTWLRVQDALHKPLPEVPPFPTFDPARVDNPTEELTMRRPPPGAGEQWFWKAHPNDERKPIEEYYDEEWARQQARMEIDRPYRDMREEELRKKRDEPLPWFFFEERVERDSKRFDFDRLSALLSNDVPIEEARRAAMNEQNYVEAILNDERKQHRLNKQHEQQDF